MNSVFNVLVKSIIIPFYRSHAGLLIFVLFLMFGTVESNQLVNYHRTLIVGMFTSDVFMISVCFIWLLFSLKILQYILSLLKKPEYAFLTHLMLVPKQKAFGQALALMLTCFLPVLLYTVFIYGLGISQHYYTESIIIFLFQVLLMISCAGVLVFFLHSQHRFSWTVIKIRVPNLGGRLGFYISHLLQEEKIALLISKTFSLALLYIVREATEAGDDFRILGLTWLFVLLAHTFLTLKLKMFEDRYVNWMKSLPISMGRTCLLYFTLYAGLLIPELIFTISMVENSFEFVQLAFLSGSFLVFIHGYLFKPDRDPDQFSIFLFWLFIPAFFVILSKGIIVLIIILGIAGALRISQRYYAYEPV